ncbi:hypothetical protein ACTXT7_011575 [Hymenolepis weldensis]
MEEIHILHARGLTPHPTIIRRISESVTSLPELQRKWPQRRLLSRIFYEELNKAEPEQQESVKSDEAELWSTLAPMSPSFPQVFNAVRLYVSIRCEVKFLEKTIFKEYYVTDRNINFPDENETCQVPTIEHTNARYLVRGRNQCQHVPEIPYPSIPIQSSKLDSARTQP